MRLIVEPVLEREVGPFRGPCTTHETADPSHPRVALRRDADVLAKRLAKGPFGYSKSLGQSEDARGRARSSLQYARRMSHELIVGRGLHAVEPA